MKCYRIETRTISMSVLEQGVGPLVLLCHGFPESAYAWRHQLSALAKAGFRGVAPDMRGYGETDCPEAIDAYTVFHIVGDMVALLDALGESTAVIVGNDWGATVAWHSAQLRPDRFRAVVAMSVPMMRPSAAPPTTIFPQTREAMFYTLYFQQPGVADVEFAQNPKVTLRKILFAASGDAGSRGPGESTPNPFGMVSIRNGLIDPLPNPSRLPPWLTEQDLDHFARAFTASGFSGGLNYYRNLDRNWELQSALAGTRITVPALYMAGARDPGIQMPGMPEILDAMPTLVPLLQDSIIVDNAGHWLPQERPENVNEVIIRFVRNILEK